MQAVFASVFAAIVETHDVSLCAKDSPQKLGYGADICKHINDTYNLVSLQILYPVSQIAMKSLEEFKT